MAVRLDDRLFRARLAAATEAGVLKGGRIVAGHAQRLLNVSARRLTAKGAAVKAAGKTPSGPSTYYYEPSKPGEPPRKRTGTLQKSVTSTVERDGDDVVGRVGSNVPYALPLEKGTRTMAARPWLRRALTEMVETAHRNVVAEIRRRMGG